MSIRVFVKRIRVICVQSQSIYLWININGNINININVNINVNVNGNVNINVNINVNGNGNGNGNINGNVNGNIYINTKTNTLSYFNFLSSSLISKSFILANRFCMSPLTSNSQFSFPYALNQFPSGF